MVIDWFTVCAQILNFLLLVWLLKRFLYKPILDAIDVREKRIAAQLSDAEKQKAAARDERQTFERKNEEFEERRESEWNKATEEIKAERLRLLDEARKESDALRAKLQEKLKSEQLTLNREVIQRTQREVFAIARQTLADLATASLEERMGDVFVRRLRALSTAEQARLTEAHNAAIHPVVVRSTFDLPPAQRTAIQAAVSDTLGGTIAVQFETSPELVCGIELLLDGHKVAWSIADYLARVEQSVGELGAEQLK